VKDRPRSIEREAAKAISEFYARIGASPVSRIPVLGREGPDIEINETKLVIDVKSRLQVPKGALAPKGSLIQLDDDLLGVRISEVELAFHAPLYPETRPASDLVYRWWLHMDRWRKVECPSGISVLALHRPGMHIASITLVFHILDWRKFYDNCCCNHHYPYPNGANPGTDNPCNQSRSTD
jgi:hypothetical protein